MTKKSFFLYLVAAVLACACSPKQPQESTIPKKDVELAGNAFSSFSLGGDVKLFTVQNPENNSQWTIQATVPVRKEISTPIKKLTIDLVMLDDRGVRVRDGLVLKGEDIANLLPVYNASENVERAIVFSISDKDKKFMSYKDVSQLMEKTKTLRMDFNAQMSQETSTTTTTETPAASNKTPTKTTTTKATNTSTVTEYPMTLDGLCRKYGIYGRLSQYESALRRGDKRGAKQIEDNMWAIEKRVKADPSIPERLRDNFVRYIEDKEDEIEDRY